MAESSGLELTHRPRRNRKSASIRALVRETRLSPQSLILPLFVMEGRDRSDEIASMPDCRRWSRDRLIPVAREAFALGIPAVALFPALSEEIKDQHATESVNPDGLLQNAIRDLKNALPEMTVISDVAMDPYSSDGHDGLVENGRILNDPTLEILAAMAVSQAEAGADIVAPSDMMDGRVGVIRQALDAASHSDVSILSYAAKYASAFYGPFRDALDSAPKSGDKKTYQMDPANSREALREVFLDIDEGADIVMVKPALPYLDVIARVREAVDIPVAAYNVSGEYAMVKAAARNGWLDEGSVVDEILLSIRRAGADIILTYSALDAAKRMQ
jgi:porphobilinogen synthase